MERMREGPRKRGSMSKIRKDYERSLWRRFLRFVNGEEWKEPGLCEPKETELPAENEAKAVHFDDDNQQPEGNVVGLFHAEPVAEDQRSPVVNEKGMRIFRRFYGFVSMGVCILIIAVLLMTVADLPTFGSADTPANSNEVAERYIVKGQEETGAVNIVTGMILDYRAFDTLGESHVLFIAACSVLILLRIDHDKKGSKGRQMTEDEENDRKFEPKNDVILQKAAFFLVPCIILFGIYVILNGHISPGGGFSGGAIVGAGLILHLNAFGFEKTERFFTYKTFSTVSLCALLFYSIAKCYSFFCGANHLESGIPMGTAGDILSSGLILPLNICVGCVVACTMYAFYSIFRKGGL